MPPSRPPKTPPAGPDSALADAAPRKADASAQLGELRQVDDLQQAPPRGNPEPLALRAQRSQLRRWAEKALAGQGRRWLAVQESSSVVVLKASVLAGLAVGVFQLATVKPAEAPSVPAPADGFPELPSTEMWPECADRELPRAARCLHPFLLEQLPPWDARRMPS